MKKLLILSTLNLFVVLTSTAQDNVENIRKIRPLGVNAGMNYFTSEQHGYYLINMNYFATAHVDLQLNIGSGFEEGAYFSAGSYFHIYNRNSDQSFTPFTGLLLGSDRSNGFVQVPIGVNYSHESGFNSSLSFNGVLYNNDDHQSTFIMLTIGWRFPV